MKMKKYTKSQKIGFAMVIVSCILFALLPFHVCLPLSTCVIGELTMMTWISSEVLFYVGGAILGKSAMDALKKKISINQLKEKICKRERKS